MIGAFALLGLVSEIDVFFAIDVQSFVRWQSYPQRLPDSVTDMHVHQISQSFLHFSHTHQLKLNLSLARRFFQYVADPHHDLLKELDRNMP